LDLRLPPLETVTPGELIRAVLDLWPSYFAFALSFATILIMATRSPAKQIATTRKRVAIGFMVYLVSAGLALVNAYLGLGLITAMWAFWGTVAYRALNEQRAWSAEA
jgi:hypothetical protein